MYSVTVIRRQAAHLLRSTAKQAHRQLSVHHPVQTFPGLCRHGRIEQSRIFHRSINVCLQRFSSSKDDGDGSKSSETDVDPLYKLPRRLVKRLVKQGITEQEFITKLKASERPYQPMTQFDPVSSSYTNSKEDIETLIRNMSTQPPFISEVDSFPSDMDKYKQWEKTEIAKTIRPKVDPSTTSIILFPGQGSQFVGMGKTLLEYPGVRDMYDEASSILGYDLLQVCLEGPKTKLDQTVYCQPSVLISSLAAIEKLREEHPQAVESCVATAGFSVGEFAALVFSGVITFPDAVEVVKVRAEAMQKASERIASGMMSVFLAHNSNLKGAMKTARDYCSQRQNINDPVCTVANYLFPECKVIAGHKEALEFIATNGKEFGLLRTKRLPVSGAFHTSMMESAVRPLQSALARVVIGKPKIPVYSNVTSQPFHVKTNYSHLLGQQLIKPVKWEQIMHAIYSRDQGLSFPQTYEVGPGRQMGTLLKQVNSKAYQNYHSIDV